MPRPNKPANDNPDAPKPPRGSRRGNGSPDRMNDPDLRVARSLAALFNPVLFPGVGDVLRITQQELAYLVGLSRQRVNEALAALEAQGVIQVEYGGLRVLDLEAMRSGPIAPSKSTVPAGQPRSRRRWTNARVHA